jgi:hypothetical protein
MKTSSIITAGLFILFATSFTAVNARQSGGEPPVKILPTTQQGILKVLYAAETGKSVDVRFFNKDKVLGFDKIKGDHNFNGFIKKYDISRLKSENFWIEISSASMDVTYKIIPLEDGTFTPILEKTTYNHPLVAAKN